MPALGGIRTVSAAWSCWRRVHAESKTMTQLMLLRDFIHQSLYCPREGYFAKANAPVARLTNPLNFASFLGQSDYLAAVTRAYEELEVAWLTPSEIFSPHYGRAIAGFLLQECTAAGHKKLDILEIGGGTGTLAKDVLDSIRKEAPEIYQQCSYTVREISQNLRNIQTDWVRSAGHGGRFRVQLHDATSRTQDIQPVPQHRYIIATEVLDNCGHDKVMKASNGAWQAEYIRTNEDGRLSREFRDIDDECIQSCLHAALHLPQPATSLMQRARHFITGSKPSPQPYSGESEIFLPTKAYMLLKALVAEFPHHSLLLADFDELPEVTIPGRNAPLVATTENGKTVDHSSYLVPWGSADIFFPTDFQLLQQLYSNAAGPGASSKVLSNAQFMTTYGDATSSSTRSGYNPLVEDYTNTAFFLGSNKLGGI